MSDPLEVEVWTTRSCPASDATVTKLGMLGLTHTVHRLSPPMRRLFEGRGYRLSPHVVVWLGEGGRRVRYLEWDGHNPRMLDLAARVAEAQEAAT